MSKVILQKFSLKLAINTKKHKSNVVKASDLIEGKVIEDTDGTWKVQTIVNNEVVLFPITKESYNLKGKTDIFTIKKDSTNHRTRLIRTIEDARLFSCEYNNHYAPFAPNWTVKGNIITDNFIKYFNIVKLIGINDYIL